MYVCVLKGKELELSMPKSAETQFMAVLRHALTPWSEGQISYCLFLVSMIERGMMCMSLQLHVFTRGCYAIM